MDIEKVIKKRRSVRSYREQAVEKEKLKKVLEAARLAPSAKNEQAWKFVVVRDKSTRQALAEAAAGQSFVGEAPVVIAAIALDPERVMGCGVPAYAVDLAIAIDHMSLQAADLGLGTCWIGAFDQKRVKEILKIPAEVKVVSLLPLGYPADSPGLKNRKALGEIVCFDSFKSK